MITLLVFSFIMFVGISGPLPDVPDPVPNASFGGSDSGAPASPALPSQGKAPESPVPVFIEAAAMSEVVSGGEPLTGVTETSAAGVKSETPLAGSVEIQSETVLQYSEQSSGAASLVMRIEPIIFAFDSVALSPASRQRLARVLQAMKLSEGSSALIAGYSDSKGNVVYNRDLSEKRANAVAEYLVSSGIQRHRLEVEGRGIYNDVDNIALLDMVDAAERGRIVQIEIHDHIRP